jgi:ABC-type bacteriocin/lantibiotic exporter with double-glycine peptidase domain
LHLKSYNRIEHTILRFQAENEKEIHTRFQAARLFALNEGLSDTMSVLSTIAVIFVSAYLVLTGHITMGNVTAPKQQEKEFPLFITPLNFSMYRFPIAPIQPCYPILP